MIITQRILILFILMICFFINESVSVAVAASDELPVQHNWVEITGKYHLISNSCDDWRGGEARASIVVGKDDVFLFDFLAQNAFRDDGIYGSVVDMHTWSEDWYSQVAVGTGSGQFYFPDIRGDASLSKKWLPSRNLITTLGGGFSKAKDVHCDMYLLASITAYFPRVFIVEAGTRITWSNPGEVRSERGFGVVTYGADHNRYVTLRYEGGKEGYQAIGSSTFIVDFTSQEASLSWREWIAKNYGTVTKIEYYNNPFYSRTGLTFGVFYEW
ncbi:YaiO family outer membrane beta-barrel protein [Geobacter sp. FeAm09]|uniref:YaiO family outer membrane beta-barrel protein n=1 Tax=Geobacter sp. FeAm09 TaxID=2597769 RepID=UPI0011EFC535|nr:YaiO family outer membrane beta-barrel protein [Geobacter sp. FeAm09]QEM68230.1 YaiO family outer membrane beta-barrel protein [Geobacter sp. FeAm09]